MIFLPVPWHSRQYVVPWPRHLGHINLGIAVYSWAMTSPTLHHVNDITHWAETTQTEQTFQDSTVFAFTNLLDPFTSRIVAGCPKARRATLTCRARAVSGLQSAPFAK